MKTNLILIMITVFIGACTNKNSNQEQIIESKDLTGYECSQAPYGNCSFQ